MPKIDLTSTLRRGTATVGKVCRGSTLILGGGRSVAHALVQLPGALYRRRHQQRRRGCAEGVAASHYGIARHLVGGLPAVLAPVLETQTAPSSPRPNGYRRSTRYMDWPSVSCPYVKPVTASPASSTNPSK